MLEVMLGMSVVDEVQLVADGAAVLASLFLAGAFAISGVPKIRDLEGATVEVLDYRLVPEIAARPVALLVGSASVLAAAGLLLLEPWGALIAVFLLAVFTLAVTAAVLRGLEIDCHCSPGTGEPVGWHTVLRNVLLLCVGLALMGRPVEGLHASNLFVGGTLGAVLLTLVSLRFAARVREVER